MTVEVRVATDDDEIGVRNVIDGAALQRGVPDLATALAGGEVLVAVEDSRVLGALVLDGDEIVAVAVRRRRRDQGIGRALVEATLQREGALWATFDPDVRPFWVAVGFEVAGRTEEGRFRARAEGLPSSDRA